MTLLNTKNVLGFVFKFDKMMQLARGGDRKCYCGGSRKNREAIFQQTPDEILGGAIKIRAANFNKHRPPIALEKL